MIDGRSSNGRKHRTCYQKVGSSAFPVSTRNTEGRLSRGRVLRRFFNWETRHCSQNGQGEQWRHVAAPLLDTHPAIRKNVAIVKRWSWWFSFSERRCAWAMEWTVTRVVAIGTAGTCSGDHGSSRGNRTPTLPPPWVRNVFALSLIDRMCMSGSYIYCKKNSHGIVHVSEPPRL